MTVIQKVNPANQDVEQDLWSNTGNMTANPPINGAFYGDFGMNLAYNSNNSSSGISNLIAQLHYGPGITPGFRITADIATQQAFLQVGLTSADTNSATAKYFHMNPDAGAPGGATMPVNGLPFYSQQIFNANIMITGAGPLELTSMDVGMTPDTGASTTLHNTQLSPSPLPDEYADFIGWSNPAEDLGQLQDGLQFTLSGTTTLGETVGILDFTTTNLPNQGNVMVQNNRPSNTTYYLNTGISLFYQYSVIYNMQDGIIGLDVIPEPSSGLLVLLSSAAGFLFWKSRVSRRA